MIVWYWIGGILSLLLFVYLAWALLEPERFQ
jgi:K+-transporting ATPase KdpF subunit